MSAKTKIVVLRMKELIYTGIFVALGILLIILLIIMFLPDKDNNQPSDLPTSGSAASATDSSALNSKDAYIPGIYTTELVLNDQSIDVEVIVDQSSITSVRLVNLSESITTMYPLLEPTFDHICSQVYEKQSVEGITYETENKYTSLVLLEAIRSSLEKAQLQSE